ncbi:hypothetical protein B0E55_05460 [Rhodococcus sp. 66b]|nr:hypothetical protein B0E55_05460 [Rhodococcus sp. 66b]
MIRVQWADPIGIVDLRCEVAIEVEIVDLDRIDSVRKCWRRLGVGDHDQRCRVCQHVCDALVGIRRIHRNVRCSGLGNSPQCEDGLRRTWKRHRNSCFGAYPTFDEEPSQL